MILYFIHYLTYIFLVRLDTTSQFSFITLVKKYTSINHKIFYNLT